jgi:signal transduction histidine kinase
VQTPAATTLARRRLSRVGLITWAVVGVPFLITALRSPGEFRDPSTLTALAGYALFLACFIVTARPSGLPTARSYFLLAIQSLASAAAGIFVFAGVFAPGGILTVIIATQLAIYAPRRGWWWIAAQTALLLMAYLLAQWPPQIAVPIALAFGAFQCFAFVSARIAEREAAARRELADLNARLLEAQKQLASAAATAERARLWRELHDVMGHHLAALSLNLEAAANLTQGRGQELVRHARALSRLMLADIRSVLSEPEAAPTAAEQPDLAAQLATLGRDLPGVSIHLDLGHLTPAPPPAAAHALLRAAQECITNATVHGLARNIHLVCRIDEGQYVLEARDDGRGTGTITPGTGLTHMRRRFQDLGGRVEWTSRLGAGFTIRAAIPLATLAPAQEAAP